MNALMNSVQLIGNLGKDVELKTLDNGNKMAKVTLATNEFYKNAKGEKVQDTQWHNIIAWGKTAEIMSEHAKKGQRIMVQGKLKYSSFEGKDGNTRYVSNVEVNEFLRLTKEETPF